MKKLNLVGLVVLSILTAGTSYAIETRTNQNKPVSNNSNYLTKTDNDSCHDELLKARLQTIYNLNSILYPFNIDVDVQDGIAKLSGNVRNEYQKELAVSLAKDIDGFQTVIAENLGIDPKTRYGESSSGDYFQKMTDATITAAVKTKLLAASNVHGRDIKVTTTNSTVVLEGFVQTAAERSKAGKLAVKTTGVSAIKNNLQIQKKHVDKG